MDAATQRGVAGEHEHVARAADLVERVLLGKAELQSDEVRELVLARLDQLRGAEQDLLALVAGELRLVVACDLEGLGRMFGGAGGQSPVFYNLPMALAALLVLWEHSFGLTTGGDPLGTLIGAFIMSVLINGLRIMSVAQEWQMVLTGVIIILAVYTDNLRRKKL